MLETLFIIHRAKMLLPIFPYTMDQQGSPCYHSFLLVTLSYHSKVNLVGALDAETLVAAVLLYELWIGFPTSLLCIIAYKNCDLCKIKLLVKIEMIPSKIKWLLLWANSYFSSSFQERMRQQAIKDKEKERTNFYQKQREAAKGERAKIREKVHGCQCSAVYLNFFLYKLSTWKCILRRLSQNWNISPHKARIDGHCSLSIEDSLVYTNFS